MNSWFWNKQELDFHHFKARKIGFQPWNMAWKPSNKRGLIPWRPFVCSVRQRHRFRGRAHTGAQWPGGQPSVDDIGYSLWTNDPLRSILGKLSTMGTSQFTLENYHFCGWFAYYFYQRVRISGLFYASSAGSSDSSKEKTSSGTKNQAPLRAKVFFSGKTGNALSEVVTVDDSLPESYMQKTSNETADVWGTLDKLTSAKYLIISNQIQLGPWPGGHAPSTAKSLGSLGSFKKSSFGWWKRHL